MKHALLLSGLLAAAALPACMVYDESLLEEEGLPDGLGGTGGITGDTGGMTSSGGATSGGASTGGAPSGGGTGGSGAGGDGSGSSTSSGGVGGTGGDGGTGGTGGTGGASANEALIDDLSHSDEAYLHIPFVGTWRLADDKTAGGTWESPAAPSFSSPFATSDRGGGDFAVHAKANGFTNWGVDVYVSLQETQADGSKPYDASQYTGIYFWAKADSTWKKVKVSVEDQTSHSDFMHLGMDKSVTATWTRYQVPFSDIEFGKARTIERDKVYALHFSMASNAVDFWIDDVGLYK